LGRREKVKREHEALAAALRSALYRRGYFRCARPKIFSDGVTERACFVAQGETCATILEHHLRFFCHPAFAGIVCFWMCYAF